MVAVVMELFWRRFPGNCRIGTRGVHIPHECPGEHGAERAEGGADPGLTRFRGTKPDTARLLGVEGGGGRRQRQRTGDDPVHRQHP